MTVEPIGLADLPRVTAVDAATSRLAARLMAWFPRRTEVEVARLGSVVLTCEGLCTPEGSLAEPVVFGLTRGIGAGRLLLEARLARGLMAVLLGPPEAQSLRRLGFGERGLLAGTLATLLEGLGVDACLTSEPVARGAAALAFSIEVAAAQISGRAVVEVPPHWVSAGADHHRWRERAAGLPVVGRLVLAATRVSAGALASMEPGDAIVFDGAVSLPTDAQAAWPVRLTLGDYAAAAGLASDAILTVHGPFQRIRSPAARIRATKEDSMEPSASSVEITAVLASTPIEVIAELGRVMLRGDEVLALAPGTVFVLGTHRMPVVTLRIGEEIWAEGELVDVDGELGVRVNVVTRPVTSSTA